MTLKECEKRNNALFAAAVRWAKEEDGERLEPYEIAIICDILNIMPPKCLYHLNYTDYPNHANATGAHAQIFSFLKKLQKELLK